MSSNISYYFSLKKENEKLAIENLILNDRLHNSINVKCISVSDSTFLIPDSLKNLYSFLPARLISMTIHESKNYAVIEKGRREGISENSGVYTPNGILGIVSSVSDRYSLLKTYMHPDVKISSAINAHSHISRKDRTLESDRCYRLTDKFPALLAIWTERR